MATHTAAKKRKFESSPADREPKNMREGSKREESHDREQTMRMRPGTSTTGFSPSRTYAKSGRGR